MSLLRTVLYLFAWVLVRPLVWSAWLCARVSGRRYRECFASLAEVVAFLPPPLGTLMRRFFYQSTLVACGMRLDIRLGAIIGYPDTRIGHNVFISRFSNIWLAVIGDDVLIANHVSILSSGDAHLTDRTDIPMRLQGQDIRPTRIGNDVWIGAHAVVLNHVGDHSVIGAGAVVVHEIPPYSVAVGNPARVVKNRGTPTPDDVPDAR